jgi:acetyl esterase/lipase
MRRLAITGYLAVAASTLLAGCSSALFSLANAPTHFSGVQRTSDIAYGSQPRQQLDVYTPAHAAHLPVVIFWYGGGWTTGDRKSYRFVATALAQQGFVTVLPDYRLYPAVRFPTFLEDSARAVAWVQQHAGEFGGDPQRIVLMGHSAGAHIATFLAFNHTFVANAGAHPEWLRGVIGLSGPYALDPNTDVLRTIFASPYTAADWRPVNFVDASSPPTLLLHGLDDDVVAPGHAEKLRDALRSAGIEVRANFFASRSHADTVAAFAWLARSRVPVLEQSATFIRHVTTSALPAH